jgi:7-carboxy-7-deazaguanine synthase
LGVTYEFLCKFDVNPPSNKPYLKVVVFSDEDYEYAKMVHHYCPYWEMFLSVGNEDPSLATVGNDATPDVETVPEEVTQQVVLGKMAWLMEKVAADRAMRNVRVLPQLHVLAWGNELGR